jgi:hypothetical protein
MCVAMNIHTREQGGWYKRDGVANVQGEIPSASERTNRSQIKTSMILEECMCQVVGFPSFMRE